MRCAYVYKGRPCPRPPDDGRRIEFGNGDQVEVLFCHPHAMAFDATVWAANYRERAADG